MQARAQTPIYQSLVPTRLAPTPVAKGPDTLRLKVKLYFNEIDRRLATDVAVSFLGADPIRDRQPGSGSDRTKTAYVIIPVHQAFGMDAVIVVINALTGNHYRIIDLDIQLDDVIKSRIAIATVHMDEV